MFSEYASRFLAQSQSRISSFGQPTSSDSTTNPSRGPVDRSNRLGRPSRFPPARSYLQRPSAANPYAAAASHLVPFPFGSRAAAPAPLFYSATDDFREEDDEAEREREVADLYALQRSRRQFGAARLEESSEADDDNVSRSSELVDDGRRRGYFRGAGIKSSWKGDPADRSRRKEALSAKNNQENLEAASIHTTVSGERRPMVDIRLESSLAERDDFQEEDEGEDEPANEYAVDGAPDGPPAFQRFRKQDAPPRFAHGAFLPYDTAPQDVLDRPRRTSSDASSIPQSISYPATQPPTHDPFWSSLFFLSAASLFATFFLVYLHTSVPNKRPLGDTIYTTLRSSFHLLAIDTLVAIVVSLLWLSLLRSFIRPLIYVILVAVPVIFTSFSIYPFVASFRGPYQGSSFQDRAMRWLSLFPVLAAALWMYTVYRGRRSLRKATEMLEFGCRVLSANPALLLLGFATLVVVVLWTWVWMAMFTRVFLGGHISRAGDGSGSGSGSKARRLLFVLDAGTWWLGVYFALVYLWTLAVASGVQRATTAATVSQWYFHRRAVPATPSQQVVLAALNHACTTSFGTICLSTLLALLVRLPVLLLPRRLVGLMSLIAYSVVPASLTTLLHPLTLSHAAIHSQPLATSAKHLNANQMDSPNFFASPASTSRSVHPYRLAKLLLHATRFIMTLTLGFGGWVTTARSALSSTDVGSGGGSDGGSGRPRVGSLYAYVVGLIAAVIGWAVLGAIEGVLGGILDAALVCWLTEPKYDLERRATAADDDGGGDNGESSFERRWLDDNVPLQGRVKEGRYCLEANHLFGE